MSQHYPLSSSHDERLRLIAQGELFKVLASVVRSQMGAIVASGAATEAEIDIETLEGRLIADAPPQGVVGYFNSGHVGVWARKP